MNLNLSSINYLNLFIDSFFFYQQIKAIKEKLVFNSHIFIGLNAEYLQLI
jgi:hypothetical protein